MFDLKISSIIAGTAFVLSLLIGLVSSTKMPILLLRPLIFAALFFVITALVKMMISRYLPELLEEDSLDSDLLHPGSKINITDDYGESYRNLNPYSAGQQLMGARPDDSENDIGDISDLSSKSFYARNAPPGVQNGSDGMDQNEKEGYTGERGFGEFSESSSGGKPAAAGMGRSEVFGSEEALPDLDSMAEAFIASPIGEESEKQDYSSSGQFHIKPMPSKAPAWTEDFNAKEIAQGLRTVLNRDKEG